MIKVLAHVVPGGVSAWFAVAERARGFCILHVRALISFMRATPS